MSRQRETWTGKMSESISDGRASGDVAHLNIYLDKFPDRRVELVLNTEDRKRLRKFLDFADGVAAGHKPEERPSWPESSRPECGWRQPDTSSNR